MHVGVKGCALMGGGTYRKPKPAPNNTQSGQALPWVTLEEDSSVEAEPGLPFLTAALEKMKTPILVI